MPSAPLREVGLGCQRIALPPATAREAAREIFDRWIFVTVADEQHREFREQRPQELAQASVR